jgi:hypothetical protein
MRRMNMSLTVGNWHKALQHDLPVVISGGTVYVADLQHPDEPFAHIHGFIWGSLVEMALAVEEAGSVPDMAFTVCSSDFPCGFDRRDTEHAWPTFSLQWVEWKWNIPVPNAMLWETRSMFETPWNERYPWKNKLEMGVWRGSLMCPMSEDRCRRCSRLLVQAMSQVPTECGNCTEVASGRAPCPPCKKKRAYCFRSTSGTTRILGSENVAALAGDDLTHERCARLCHNRNMPLAGVEYGRECYCFAVADLLSAEKGDSCNMPCPGNPAQTCGGEYHISVFEVDCRCDCVPAPSHTKTAHEQCPDAVLEVGFTTLYGYDKRNQCALDAGYKEVSRLPFDSFAAYKYLVHTDGQGAAYRLQKLLAMNSVVLKQESDFKEYYYDWLVPGKHYVPFTCAGYARPLWYQEQLKNTCNNCSATPTPAPVTMQCTLNTTILEARRNDEQMQRIAQDASQFARRFFTRAAVRRYWLGALKAYHSLGLQLGDVFDTQKGNVSPEHSPGAQYVDYYFGSSAVAAREHGDFGWFQRSGTKLKFGAILRSSRASEKFGWRR